MAVRRNGSAEAADVDPLRCSGEVIGARMDRLPFSRWHMRMLVVIGSCHLFDMFDALTMAFVLPVLIKAWDLNALQAGLLLSVSYVGQFAGAIVMGGVAGRIGRRRALRWTLFQLAGLSLACALAPNYAVLLVLRLVQGFGLGGEMPVAATYINEIAPARLRGRIGFVPQIMAGLGAIVTAGVAMVMVPRFGWQSMFVIGGGPLLMAALLPRLIPESPRWLASSGKGAEADAILTRLEQAVPSGAAFEAPTPAPVAGAPEPVAFMALLSPDRVRQTLAAWITMLCIALASYGLIGWLPSIYTSVFDAPVDLALRYGLIMSVVGPIGGICGALLIDKIGRRGTFLLSFLGVAVPFIIIYSRGAAVDAHAVMVLSSVSVVFAAISLSGLYVYASEIYPTHLRTLGVGVASSWLRVGNIVAPLMIGGMLAYSSVAVIFLVLGCIALIGAAAVVLLIRETAGRSLEDITSKP